MAIAYKVRHVVVMTRHARMQPVRQIDRLHGRYRDDPLSCEVWSRHARELWCLLVTQAEVVVVVLMRERSGKFRGILTANP